MNKLEKFKINIIRNFERYDEKIEHYRNILNMTKYKPTYRDLEYTNKRRKQQGI